MKISTTLPVLFILLGFIGAQASADKIISLTGHPDYPPVTHFNSANKKLEGQGVLLITKALEELGYKVRVVHTGSWARAQDQVKTGAIDILLPPYRTPEREEWMLFSNKPFMDDESAIFVAKKNKNIQIQNLKDLAKYKGVAIINDSFGADFDKLDSELLKMTRVGSTELCFRMITKERADYVVAGLHAGQKVLNDLMLKDQIDVLPLRVVVTGMYVGLSKKSPFAKDPQFMTKLDSKIKELKAKMPTKKSP